MILNSESVWILNYLVSKPSPTDLTFIVHTKLMKSLRPSGTMLIALSNPGEPKCLGYSGEQRIGNLLDRRKELIWNHIEGIGKDAGAINLFSGAKELDSLDNSRSVLFAPICYAGAMVGGLVFDAANKDLGLLKADSIIKSTCALISPYLMVYQLERQILEIDSEKNAKPPKLSDRQILVLENLHRGLKKNQIALKLGYSYSTIHHETLMIYRTLGVRGKQDAIDRAMELGLVGSTA